VKARRPAEALGFSAARVYYRSVPTVLRVGGLRFAIHPSDHTPAHVHAIGPGRAVVVNSHGPEAREVVSPCAERDARWVLDLAREHRAALPEVWRRTHG
jgi:hypothetical protein